MKLIWLAAFALLLCGCSASDPPSAAQNSGGAAVSSADDVVGLNGADITKLEAIRLSREREQSDFAIGVGDVLEIKVPDIDELQDQTVRVRGDGAITLPLLGSMQAAGLTEEQLQALLLDRLGKYLVRPQAEIFVKSYSSRQVAVLGAVQKPGTYTLEGPTDTIRAVLERAGGITEQAAPEVVLTPGGPPGAEIAPPDLKGGDSIVTASAQNEAMHDSAQSEGQLVSTSATLPDPSSSPGLQTLSPVVISLAAGSNDRRYLDLPARPGDTISVPQAGSVSVVGWVYGPKTIPITPGMTVLGAVSAAGGALFAADTSSVKVYRQEPHGEKSVMTVDLNKVQKREIPDIALRENDVVDVPYSALKVPGYALYYAVQGIVSFAPAAAVASGS